MRKMNYLDILNSIPVPRRFASDPHVMLYYKLGAMAKTLADMANRDSLLNRTIERRLNDPVPQGYTRNTLAGLPPAQTASKPKNM